MHKILKFYSDLKGSYEKYAIDFQLPPLHMHRINATEQVIRTSNNQFFSLFSTTDTNFPISKWVRLLSQCVITMNILHNSRVNPALSAYAYLYGPYNFNKSPMATPGTCVIVHNKPGNFKSWIHNSIPGWYIGPLLYHCRCKQFFMPATGIIWITDTLQYIPKAIVPPKTTTEDYLQQAIGDII